MISTAKIVTVSTDRTKILRSCSEQSYSIPDSEEYVEVIFDDGTFVALSEEELRSAAALAEKGCLSG